MFPTLILVGVVHFWIGSVTTVTTVNAQQISTVISSPITPLNRPLSSPKSSPFTTSVLSPQLPPVATSPFRAIVQLGDSYASGNGAGNYVGVDGCFRSNIAWGAQFAQLINAASRYTNRGCSAGKYGDIYNARVLGTVSKDSDGKCPTPVSGSDEFYTAIDGSWTCSRLVKSQLAALNSTVDLVLLAMGGNDIQIQRVFESCLIAGLRDVRDCEQNIRFVRDNAGSWSKELSEVLISIVPKLKPTARVIVLQYPHIVQNTPYTLVELFGDSIEITNNLRSLGTILDDSQRSAIATANAAANRNFVLYYDRVKTIFEGHEPHPSAFSNNENSWIYEGTAPVAQEIYHLNPTGHTELGKALHKYVASLDTPTAPVAPSPVFPNPSPIAPSPIAAPTSRTGGCNFLKALFTFLREWLFEQ